MFKKTALAMTAAAVLATAVAPTAANAGTLRLHGHGHGLSANIWIGTPGYTPGYRTVCKWKKVRVKKNNRWKWVRVKKCYRVY